MMDLNNGNGKKQRKDFVTKRQTRNRVNAEMEDYVRSLSSEINQVNPNYSSQFPGAVVAGSDSNYIVAESSMQQESLLTKQICESSTISSNANLLAASDDTSVTMSDDTTVTNDIDDAGLLHEDHYSFKSVDDEWTNFEFDDGESQIIESSEEEDVTYDELDMQDWSVYSSDDDDDDGVNSPSCFAQSCDSKEASKLKKSLAEWVVKSRTPRMHVNSLLRILKVDGDLKFLPIDARTLLKSTRKKLQFESVPPGHYHHIGLESVLMSFLEGLKCKGKPIPKKILLFINVDGIPLANSSSSEFWPILFRVLGYDYVFIAGVYHGYGKPYDVNQFLSAFRDEFIKIRTSGLIFEGKNIPVAMSGMCSDAPATTFMLNIATHNAYYGCRKCVTSGVWVANVSTVTMTKKGGRVTYPDVNASLRTDSSFRNRLQIKHHNKNGIRSIAEDLFTDVIKDVVIDPMHCVYIGVHKKIAGIWFNDPFDKIRLSKEQLLQISAFRVAVGQYMPFDFARKTRPVKDFPRWKSSELKFDLNYLGPVSYKKFLTAACYKHFLLLHVAIRLLSDKDHCESQASYANDLLRLFVTNSASLYSAKFISINVHCLIHLAEDVLIHGNLDNYSAFCFENKLQLIKNMLKKSGRPLHQIARRLEEESRIVNFANDARNTDSSFIENFKVEGYHTSGPVIPAFEAGNQYKKLRFKNSRLTNAIPDNCVIIVEGAHKIIVLIRNWIEMPNGNIFLLGNRFTKQEDLFSYPLPSSYIDEFVVSSLSNVLESFPLSSVKYKCVCFPTTFPETGFFFASRMINLNVN